MLHLTHWYTFLQFNVKKARSCITMQVKCVLFLSFRRKIVRNPKLMCIDISQTYCEVSKYLYSLLSSFRGRPK